MDMVGNENFDIQLEEAVHFDTGEDFILLRDVQEKCSVNLIVGKFHKY